MHLIPLTGRTHQLRVHMLALGHPILGDQFYATGEALAAADRLQLHAEELGFAHPDGTPMVISLADAILGTAAFATIFPSNDHDGVQGTPRPSH